MTSLSAGSGESGPLAVCTYCHRIVGAQRSFASMWHLGTGDDAPSCCLTEHYLRQQASMQQAPQQPQSSGPIKISPQKQGGVTSPLIIVDESRR